MDLQYQWEDNVKLRIERHETTSEIPFIVADTKSSAILGLKSCKDLNLIARVEELREQTKAELLFDEFKDCFGEIGTLPKIHHITIKEDVQPVIHSARRVPFALKDRLKEELNRMVRLGVIESVTEPTDWVNQLVVQVSCSIKCIICRRFLTYVC